jgi:hypothetical protein
MKATIKIIGANKYHTGIIDRTFQNVTIARNKEGTIVFLTEDSLISEFFIDKNSSIHFTDHGFVIEGYGVIGYNVGKLSILIQSYETNAII